MSYLIGGELAHHGILGQRHGVRNGPPYPLRRGDHSAAERNLAKRGIKTLTGYIKNTVNKHKKKKALEAAKKKRAETLRLKREREAHEANRENVLKSGNATEVLKYKGELSNNELQDVLNRIQKEDQLIARSSKDVKTATDKVDDIINKLDRARGWTEKGVAAYNTAAKIINAFSDYDDMPIIGEKHKTREQKRDENMQSMIKKLQVENNQLKNDVLRNQNDYNKTKQDLEIKEIKRIMKQNKKLRKDSLEEIRGKKGK